MNDAFLPANEDGGQTDAMKIEGKVFLFEQPELLNARDHGDLGIKAPDSLYSFAANQKALPVLITEFPSATRDYPVIFTNPTNPAPLVAVGLGAEKNLYIDEEGRWDEYRYIPAYLRRYPFAIATTQGANQFGVVIDRKSDYVTDDPEIPFFENGQMSERIKKMTEFLSAFEQDRRRTETFCKKLVELELLAPQQATYTPEAGGDPVVIAEYTAVNEQKLKELPDDVLVDLAKTNILPMIYAHLLSLNHWPLLYARAQKAAGANPPGAA